MQHEMHQVVRIEPSRQGSYFTLPFEVPQNIELIQIEYQYQRRPTDEQIFQGGSFTATPEKNIIDLGLIDPRGRQVGASGSDKTEIQVSETYTTPGYTACRVEPGEWKIIIGAYKVQPEGVEVNYHIRMTEKSLRLLKGDLHVHSIASDGVHTLQELALKAKAHGLDFLAVTDHNQFTTSQALPRIHGLTMIPGVEWTHYRGHANFLGIDQPYDEPFITNTDEAAHNRFAKVRERGALITVNHPYEGNSSFLFDLLKFPFDCLEVWNGPMRESNLRAVGLWQELLKQGLRIPICGGSDYHRDTPFIFLGGPTTWLYSWSAGVSDILAALRSGHGFITFAPGGPVLDMKAGEAIMGDQVDWSETRELQIRLDNLSVGDEVRVVTSEGPETLFKVSSDGCLNLEYQMNKPGFARLEVHRTFLPGLPMLPALLSNPIYFKG